MIEHNHLQREYDASNSQRRDRMIIPEGTIVKDEPRSLSLPFYWLRTWLLSLAALVLLPVGLALIVMGVEMENQPIWEAAEAVVTGTGDSVIIFDVPEIGLTSQRATWDTLGLDYYVDGNYAAVGFDPTLVLYPLLVPADEGTTFTVYYNPDFTEYVSLLPVESDFGAFLAIIGFIMAGLSALQLFGIINTAATKPRQA